MTRDLKYRGVVIAFRDDIWPGVTVYKARDIGLALGFGSKGGNFSRNIHAKWKRIMRNGTHYIEISSRTNRLHAGGAFWLTPAGLLLAMSRTWTEEPKRIARMRGLLEAFAKHETYINKVI